MCSSKKNCGLFEINYPIAAAAAMMPLFNSTLNNLKYSRKNCNCYAKNFAE